MVAVHEDVLEGITAAAVRAGGIIASSGMKVVRVVRVEGVSCDELETRGLKGPGASKEYALGSEGGAQRRAEMKVRKRAWVGVGPRVKSEMRRELWRKMAKAAKNECGM